MPEPSSQDHPLDPDYSRACASCGDSPVVRVTGLCGPCSFGGAANAAAVWGAPRQPPAHRRPPMTRDEALIKLGTELPEEAFASIHLAEVALANRDVADDLRAGKPARVFAEWSVLITAPGFSHSFAGDELGAVVAQALEEFSADRAARDAEEWARAAFPDAKPAVEPDAAKPPRLTAPTSAEEERRRRREHGKDAG